MTFRFGRWAPLALVMLLTVGLPGGCSGTDATPGTGEDDTILIGTPDLSRWVDVLADGRLDGMPEDSLQADIIGETGAQEDGLADQFSDVASDLPGTDQSVPPDAQLPDAEDISVEIVPELCNGVMCPADRPICQDNQCACTGSSCPAGNYCSNRLCVPCNVDLHCGPDCVSCAFDGLYCALDGSRCLGCDASHSCPAYQQCIEGACLDCGEMGLCGPNCLACSDETPVCQQDHCVCSTDSCPGSSACDGEECVACTNDDPEFCGPDCQHCGGSTPHCFEGQCTLCNENSRCGSSCSACPGLTPLCRLDGTGCVACLSDVDCAVYYHCTESGTCQPNCTAQGCQSDTSKNGEECGKEWVIGRVQAVGTVQYDRDTEDAGDDDDLGYFLGHEDCWDASYDHFYKIWLRPGDVISVTMTNKDTTEVFDAMLKLYDGPTECEVGGFLEVGDDNLVSCYDNGDDGENEQFTHQAQVEGWHWVIADGRQSGSDETDWGPYRLSVTLTCADAGCCCGQ